MFDQFTFDCPRCQIGHCHPGKSTYTRVFNGQVVSIPSITVYTCDVCGYQEYDRDALLRLQSLMGATKNTEQDEDARPKPRTANFDSSETGKSPRPKP
ncbi:MAG: hypothetical protein H7X77_09745 [Anaerolineae bacterium]|nr:hypothetical protein [Anaerolineae bacterium]